MIKNWNNSSDCEEFYYFPPFSESDDDFSGFPLDYKEIVNDIKSYISQRCPALRCYSKLSDFISGEIQKNRYALVKEVPESSDQESKYYLSFGVNNEEGYMVCPVSIRLGLEKPDWNLVRETMGFLPNSCFINFVESFPGIVFGHIDSPSFIVEPYFFTNPAEYFPQDINGKIAFPDDLLEQITGFLFFQIDYWGVYRFLSKENTVCELKGSPFSLIDKNISFDDWVSAEIDDQIDRVISRRIASSPS